MKNTQELYEQSVKNINSSDVFIEIAVEIKKITKALRTKEIKSWSADQLSRAVATLATLRVNLGDEMAEAMAQYDFAYLHRKLRYASEWKPTKKALNKQIDRATVKDIDTEVLQKIEDERTQEIENKHYAEKLKVLFDSTETLITTLQTRLGVLRQQRQEANYN